MDTCKKCQKPCDKGYHVSPKSGHKTPKQFWCDACYERSCLQSSQDRSYKESLVVINGELLQGIEAADKY